MLTLRVQNESWMRRKFIAILLAVAVSAQMMGQDALSSTRNVTEPRRAAMAGAGIASAENLSYSAFYNASMIPLSRKTLDASAGWGRFKAGPSVGSLGAAWNIGGKVGVSLAGAFDRGPAYQITDGAGNTAGGFNPSAMRIGLGLGVKIAEGLSGGVSVRYASETPAEGYSFNGFAGDFMLSYRPVERLCVTAGVSNLGTKVKDSAGNTYSQSWAAVAAADWAPVTGVHSVRADIDLGYEIAGKAFGAAAGVEYCFHDIVHARIGYRYATMGSIIPSHLGMGLGLSWAGAHIDFSYLTLGALGGSFALGLGYSF